MRVINEGIVYEGQKGTNQQSCAFPGVCILSNGRWVSSFRAAPVKESVTEQKVLITWSDNDGKSWCEPISPFSPFYINGKKGVFRSAMLASLGSTNVLAALCWVDCSNPALPFFNEETEGLLDTRIFFSRSVDCGETWSEPEMMDTAPFNVPTPITGPVLFLPGGKMACQFELNKHYYDINIWRHSSVMMYSWDGGKTWTEHCVVSNDPDNRIYYWDQRPAVLRDGIIIDLFWTFDRVTAKYLNIHARKSSDNGCTWSDIWDTGVPGQPAPIVSLPDGKIAMVYVDRSSEPVIKVRTSNDGGKVWAQDTESIIYESCTSAQTSNKSTMQDAWSEMGKFSVGLPATALLPGDDIIVVYYAGQHTDFTDIRWAKVRNEP